jgi:integrase
MGHGTTKPVRVGEGLYEYTTTAGLVRYKANIKHHDKYYRKCGFSTISKARKWRQSRVGAIADGRLFPEQEQKRKHAEAAPKVLTIDDYARTWMAACEAKGLKHTTLKRYRGILNEHVLPAFGPLPISAVDRTKMRELVGHLNTKGLKPKTIQNVVMALSALYTEAIEDGWVNHNPALRPSKLIQVPKRGERVEVFTHEEELVVLQTAQEKCPHYYPFILCLFRTGLREGEAVALRPEDLDLNHRYMLIQRNFTAGRMSDTPKNRKRRTVDLSQDLRTVLRETLVIREAEAMLHGSPSEGWLFPATQGGIIRSNNFRDRVWKPLLKAAGLSYRWVHATRHTFATRMIMGGANLVYVQKQLGHSSIQITVDLYTHWIERSERKTVLEVDRLVGQPEEDGCTPGCTQARVNAKSIDMKREKWGE